MNASSASMANADVVVIHETDGRKYLEALVVMAEAGEIGSLTFHGASVGWRLVHCLIRERKKLRPSLAIAMSNLRFRFRFPFLQNKVILLAIAPWDWRMLFYAVLVFRNRVIYNSSWPWWDGDRVPRRPGILTPLIRRVWRVALRHPNVTISAVTRPAAAALAEFLPGQVPRVIPHVVSREFFATSGRRTDHFKLLFVGELSEKKGFAEFSSIVQQLGPDVGVEIVGDGPFRHEAEALAKRPGCRWHGKISDRQQLADIASECHIFLSPARKTPKWEELFGMAIVESMAAGLVCIVTDHIGPRSFIEQGINGILVREGDHQEMTRWVNIMQSDKLQWEKMSQAAAKTAQSYAMPHVVMLWRTLIGSLFREPIVTGQNNIVPTSGAIGNNMD